MAAFEAEELAQTLKRVFGFSSFRAGQEAACLAMLGGKDSLVVMPTGSGKSLCYQLPAVVLGGTALVISPLIALMEDQVSHLNAHGLSADRIHSGRRREESRAAAAAYRSGDIRFLFISPERFSVPGFADFLGRYKPCLVVVDEAHCISQWGHDFRPDYRMLKRYLPLLRPAPIIALTATATPAVQQDILQELAIPNAIKCIQGFRRHNIAIEAVEIPPSSRADTARSILETAEHRPAIVYVPSRKDTEGLAHEWAGELRAEPYHAGLSAQRRQDVQEKFLRGDVEVIVATIAFGMGIDKANVRTVIHTALPGSIEAYYQEIGRAGRDGQPSRAILMHSYADRRRHDFFFDRDYPEIEILDRIFALLSKSRSVNKDILLKSSRLDQDLFDVALDKLWVHSGAKIDSEENVIRGDDSWRESYSTQSDRRSSQLELTLRYASASTCRMSALVRYFGDVSDVKNWCGLCDFCAPHQCIAQQFRPASGLETRIAGQIIETLKTVPGRATGRLHADLCPHNQLERDSFEELLGALARAGLITLREAVFEKDGKSIPFRTAQLTHEGSEIESGEDLSLEIRQKMEKGSSRSSRRTATKAKAVRPKTLVPTSPQEVKLFEKLKEWRLREARKKGVPAFRIAADSLLLGILEDRPLTEEDLLAISGVGSAFIKRYAEDVLAIVRANEG
jgi:RecQ family ATP-dependent DNA helicase